MTGCNLFAGQGQAGFPVLPFLQQYGCGLLNSHVALPDFKPCAPVGLPTSNYFLHPRAYPAFCTPASGVSVLPSPSSSPVPPLPADFQERMRYYSLRRQAKERAASAAADAEACTFRPDTGNAVQVLALSSSRAGNLLETEQARRRARASAS